MINPKQELLQNKPRKRRRKVDLTDKGKVIMKPDAGRMVINLSSGYLQCRWCKKKKVIPGKLYTPEIEQQVKTFKEKHINCKK